jgi:CHAT domain-containing protein
VVVGRWSSLEGVSFRVAVILALLAGSCAPSEERQLAAVFAQGETALRRGEFGDARKFADTGAQRTAARPNTAWPWRFRLLGAEASILTRDFPAAEPAIAASLPPDPAFDPLRARQHYLRAKLSIARGDLPGASQALADARALARDDRAVRLDIDHLDGQVLMRRRKWAEADALLNQVVEAAGASDPFHQAEALNDLGMGRFVRSQWDQALPYFERVIAIDQARNFSIYASSLSNAGACYQRLGQFDRAMTVQQRALEVQEHRGTRENFAVALLDMGNLYVLRGTPAGGVPFYTRALDVASRAKLTRWAAVAASNLAEAQTRLGDWEQAEKYNEESKRLKAAIGGQRLVYNTTVAAGIAEGRGRLDEAARLYEVALADKDADASVRWGAHAGLAGVARKQNRPAVAATHFEAALETIEKTRSDLLKTEYKLAYLTQLISFYRGYVDLLLEQGRTARALEVADSSRGQVLAERQHVSAPPHASAVSVQRLAAASGTTFLSYWIAPEKSYVWTIAGSGITIAALPPSSEIEPLVRAHQAAIANALADPLAANDSPGDKLFRRVVAPVAAQLKPGARVVIVPDGPLHALNFETLPVVGKDGERRHYWIEDVEVQVAPSVASVSAGQGVRAGAATALIVGDPAPRPPEFPTLKFAPAELTSVASHFGTNATVISRERATPAGYREAHPERFAFVHFAAHATANVESPLDSAVILSGPDTGYKLYARDVAAQTLAADLVTVSACKSAGERAYSGEGLVGFAWAFLRAGARRVVAGLWDVDDRSTAELMDRMYDGVARGVPPARALREAKLELLRRASPYQWGPFQLFTVAL